MSVIAQNEHGFLVHPIPPTPNVHLQLVDRPYGKCSFVPPENDSSNEVKKRKRKRNRITPLNAGEASLILYHDKVREKLLASWKSLVELGKDVNYFPVTTTLQDDVMMKKCTTPLNDASTTTTTTPNSITIHLLDEDKEDSLQPSTYDNIDFVDICNKDVLVSKPTDSRSPIIINDSFKHIMYKTDKLCGRVVNNSTRNWAIVKLSETHFAIPQNCTFLLSDIAEFQTLVDYIQCNKNMKYDCIIIDPPWENRSAIRSHKYHWLSENDLLQLPLPVICNHDCLVVVWVTNKVRFADFVRDELFPSWNVEIVGEWHWIKVTKGGEFVFDLDSLHKKPYELLILGRYQGEDILCI